MSNSNLIFTFRDDVVVVDVRGCPPKFDQIDIERDFLSDYVTVWVLPVRIKNTLFWSHVWVRPFNTHVDVQLFFKVEEVEQALMINIICFYLAVEWESWRQIVVIAIKVTDLRVVEEVG